MFKPSFGVGDIVSNQDIVREFKCGNMGGMRRSKATNTLVIVTDHTKGLYDDHWQNDILHYTGMGKSGDQSLSFQQNKTLAESSNYDITVHLFEVFVKGDYFYHGIVKLCGAPYPTRQKGEDGLLRQVWIFPLKPLAPGVAIPPKMMSEYIAAEQKRAKRLNEDDLLEKAKIRQKKTPALRKAVNSIEYVRDPYIAEYSKRCANGVCQLCKKEAPFKTKKGEWYLESHHVCWLSEGGADSIANTVALCPNCHAKMHVLNLPKDVEYLLMQAKKHNK